MEAKPTPMLDLPTRRTFVIQLLLAAAAVLFFTADWWLGARMLIQHFRVGSAVLFATMWGALASYWLKWEGAPDPWWRLFLICAVIIVLIYCAIFLPLAVFLLCFGFILYLVISVFLIVVGCLFITWIVAEVAKASQSIQWAKRLILAVTFFFLPICATMRSVYPLVTILQHTIYADHQYFLEEERWEGNSFTTLYECNALGFACREIPRSEESSIVW